MSKIDFLAETVGGAQYCTEGPDNDSILPKKLCQINNLASVIKAVYETVNSQ